MSVKTGQAHPILVAGRPPRSDHPEEAAVNEEFAWRHGLRPGGQFQVRTYTRAQFPSIEQGLPIPPEGPVAALRVAGIVRFPSDLVPVAEDRTEADADGSGQVFLTPGFWRRYGPDLANHGTSIFVDLRRGPADLPEFTAAIQRRFGDQTFVPPIEDPEQRDVRLAGVRRAIAVETTALLAFAVLATLSALLLVGQTLGRQILLESIEYPTLRALGMTRAQLVGVAVVRAAVIGAVGGMLAVAVAVALSPLTPLGIARLAEVTPGVAVDWPVLAVGGLAIVGFVAGCAAWPARRAAGALGDPLGLVDLVGRRRSSRVAGALATAAVGPTVAVGVRFALEPGRGRTAVPVRAALAGTVAAVCAITAATGYAASLAHLTSTPSNYGVTWDLSVRTYGPAAAAKPAAQRLVKHPQVATVAALLSLGSIYADGQPLPLMAIEDRKGRLPLAMVEGRQPERSNEIALGSITLRRLGKQLGDTVKVAGEGWWQASRMKIVGRAVLNEGGFDGSFTPGTGGLVHPDRLRRLAGDDPEAVSPGTYLIRVNPGVDRNQAIARLQRDFPGATKPRPHADIRNLQRVADLPSVLAALVALFALGAVTHALATSVRRRRRDLAVLKTLGFVPGQVSATIAWQATTFAVVALALGLPLGVAAGRWAWQLTTLQLGVDSAPVVPVLPLMTATAGSVLAANLAGAAPRWVASHLPPATVLHAE
jgi:FtsX-like permease family